MSLKISLNKKQKQTEPSYQHTLLLLLPTNTAYHQITTIMYPNAANQVMDLNNSGIQHMKCNNYNESMRDYSKGLAVVKQILALHEEELDVDDEMDYAEYDQDPQEDAFYFATQEHTMPTKGDDAFIFRSPIVVSVPPQDAPANVCFNYYTQMCYCLLYNLALAHHLSALDIQEQENGNKTSASLKRLQKAVALYELAYTIQMTEGIQLSILLTMAIVNNLGQIHTALGSAEKSNQCFQHLLSTIMFVNDTGEHDVVQQMDGFLSNVIPLIFPTNDQRIAPAAWSIFILG